MHKANETTVIFKVLLKESKAKREEIYSILKATTELFGPHEQKTDPSTTPRERRSLTG